MKAMGGCLGSFALFGIFVFFAYGLGMPKALAFPLSFVTPIVLALIYYVIFGKAIEKKEEQKQERRMQKALELEGAKCGKVIYAMTKKDYNLEASIGREMPKPGGDNPSGAVGDTWRIPMHTGYVTHFFGCYEITHYDQFEGDDLIVIRAVSDKRVPEHFKADYFMFKCHSCGQHIFATPWDKGKEANCVLCKNPLIVPAQCIFCGQKMSTNLDDVETSTGCPTCGKPLIVPNPPIESHGEILTKT